MRSRPKFGKRNCAGLAIRRCHRRGQRTKSRDSRGDSLDQSTRRRPKLLGGSEQASKAPETTSKMVDPVIRNSAVVMLIGGRKGVIVVAFLSPSSSSTCDRYSRRTVRGMGGRGVTPSGKSVRAVGWLCGTFYCRKLRMLQRPPFFFGPNVVAAAQVVPGTGLPERAEAFLVAGRFLVQLQVAGGWVLMLFIEDFLSTLVAGVHRTTAATTTTTTTKQRAKNKRERLCGGLAKWKWKAGKDQNERCIRAL
ncbi:hypothetical protein QBC45DRAFT_94313 [Copromyces sp. CBS 386.78]|nr:hypothetical protein QBC45DRAFT_94313 [Copromyces sp. CBS 386.78]